MRNRDRSLQVLALATLLCAVACSSAESVSQGATAPVEGAALSDPLPQFRAVGGDLAARPTFVGRLLDDEGRALVGARVRLFAELAPGRQASGLPRFLHETRTDAEGRYRFDEVLPLHRLWLECAEEERVLAQVELSALGFLGARRFQDPVVLDDLPATPDRLATVGEPWPRRATAQPALPGWSEDIIVLPAEEGLVADVGGRLVSGAVAYTWIDGRQDPLVLGVTGPDGRFAIPASVECARVEICHRAGLLTQEERLGLSPVAFEDDLRAWILCPFESVTLACQRDGFPAAPTPTELLGMRQLESAEDWALETRLDFHWATSVRPGGEASVELESIPSTLRKRFWGQSTPGMPEGGPLLRFGDKTPSVCAVRFATPDGRLEMGFVEDRYDSPTFGRVTWPRDRIPVALGPSRDLAFGTFSVTGTVRDEQGEPVPAATVELRVTHRGDRTRFRFAYQTQSDAAGHFAFDEVLPFLHAEIGARDDGFRAETQWLNGQPLRVGSWDRVEMPAVALVLDEEMVDESDDGFGWRFLEQGIEIDEEADDFWLVDPWLQPIRGAVVVGSEGGVRAVTNRFGRAVRVDGTDRSDSWSLGEIGVIVPGGKVSHWRLFEEDAPSASGFGLDDDFTAAGVIDRLLAQWDPWELDYLVVGPRLVHLQLRCVRDGQPFNPSPAEVEALLGFLADEDRSASDRIAEGAWDLEPVPGTGRFVLHAFLDDLGPRVGVYSLIDGTLDLETQLQDVTGDARRESLHFDTPSGVIQLSSDPEDWRGQVFDVVFPPRGQ